MVRYPNKLQTRLIYLWMYGPLNLALLGMAILVLFIEGPWQERASFILFLALTSLVFNVVVRKTVRHTLILPGWPQVRVCLIESLGFATIMSIISAVRHEAVTISSFLLLAFLFGLLYGPFVLFRPTLDLRSVTRKDL